MYFRVNESKVGVNNGIFSGNEQQKVYLNTGYPHEAVKRGEEGLPFTLKSFVLNP